MPLVTSNQFNLQPDISPITQQLLKAFQVKTQRDRVDQKEAEKLKLTQAKEQTQKVGAQALNLIDSGDFISQRTQIARFAQEAFKRGDTESFNVWEKLSGVEDPEELRMRLTQTGVGAADLGKFIDDRLEPKDATKKGMASAISKLLEGGGSRKILPSGEEEIRNRFNQIVTGQDAVDVIDRSAKIVADKEKATQDLRVETERSMQQVKNAESTAAKAFDKVDKIRQNISNLEKVIPLIGKGANTGPIISRLPSFKAATVELENLQKRLSLDVVGAVTFGALSKGELDLAKAVAIPLGLEGDELIKWVTGSIAAKRKLATYFEDQAIFLSNGGSRKGWLESLREKQTLKQLEESNQLSANQESAVAPVVTTQDQFNNLPSGALFIENGVQYRKP